MNFCKFFIRYNYFLYIVHSTEPGNILCTGVEDDLLVKCVLGTGAIEVDVNVCVFPVYQRSYDNIFIYFVHAKLEAITNGMFSKRTVNRNMIGLKLNQSSTVFDYTLKELRRSMVLLTYLLTLDLINTLGLEHTRSSDLGEKKFNLYILFFYSIFILFFSGMKIVLYLQNVNVSFCIASLMNQLIRFDI